MKKKCPQIFSKFGFYLLIPYKKYIERQAYFCLLTERKSETSFPYSHFPKDSESGWAFQDYQILAYSAHPTTHLFNTQYGWYSTIFMSQIPFWPRMIKTESMTKITILGTIFAQNYKFSNKNNFFPTWRDKKKSRPLFTAILGPK